LAIPDQIDDRVFSSHTGDDHDALRHELQALRRSEALLRDFIETATIALHWVGADGTILWANQAELDILGHTRAEYVGRNISEFHADEPVVNDILARLSRGETIRDYPARLRHRDGSIRHVLINSSVLFEDGKFIHTRCFTRDVTALGEQQKTGSLLTAIVDSSDDAIISKDLNGVVTSWNKSAERLFGYTQEEAAGRTIAELVIPDDRQDEEPDILARLRSGERVDHFETVRRRKDGSLLDVSLTISPVRDRTGTIVGASKIARDITERKRADDAITALNEQLQADLAAMTRMQELSTRLIQAGAFAELLEEILDAGIEITGADMGNIQLLDSDGALRIEAHRGFDGRFLKFFQDVHDGQAACGSALLTGERVVVEDVATSPVFAGTPALAAMLDAGARAVQSTPLVSRSGKLMGMFSTHYRIPRCPTERDLRLLDLLARQAADLIERKRTEDVRGQLSAIVESSGDAIYIYDFDGTILSWNHAAEELYGYKEREIVGCNVREIVPPDYRAEVPDVIHPALLRGEIIRNLESKRMRRDGSVFPALLTISPVRDERGNAVASSVIARDITDQKRTEESLRETQRLESLGLLAGGIAHDFNNLLTGVIGNASLLSDEFAAGSPQSEIVQGLMHAAERMARLTSQMLAYSGRGHFVIEPVDLSKQVIQIISLIQASIPKNVELRLSLANDLPPIEVDVSQLQQVIMNLVINAAEAIGNEQGTVAVRTELETLGQEHVKANLARTMPQHGEHVAITVEDTGCGMDDSVRSRIFDPFFTTKFTGRGLGLSSVLGIVRGHRGLITLDTHPGGGTKFRVFFPASTAGARHEAPSTHDERGRGTVLVVDDEEVVRAMATAALQRLGFSVLTAVNGSDALRIYAEQHQDIELVLLDMMMPVMGGEETLRRLFEIRPDASVIAMSGFQEREAKERFGGGIMGFLQKPFTVAQLGAEVSSARRVKGSYPAEPIL
jgi:two-component system cell cycle sensor histidine kinase/response regulator CckA